MRIEGPAGQRKGALLPDTHDRLSYLLAAQRLAMRGKGEHTIRVATPEASDESRLEFVGADALDLPVGAVDAIVVRRVTVDSNETRQLWFAAQAAPLPVRVLQDRGGNKVEMRLASVSRQ
jgi:hypothetical protein